MDWQHKKAVIFDLDGTLLDTLGIWNRVDERLIERLTGAPCEMSEDAIFHNREQALARYAKDPAPYVSYCAELGAQLGSALTAREIHALRYTISRVVLSEEVRARPGVKVFLQKLKESGIRRAVATTTRRSNIEHYARHNELVRAEIDFENDFEFLLTLEDVSAIKPDPEVYCRALDRLGLPAADCVVIEDSLSGVQAACQAGIDVIAIEEKHWLSQKEAIAQIATDVVRDFEQLSAELTAQALIAK